MDAITITQLNKQLGQFSLSIPSLNVKKGYITGFIGENGSGKTTTIKLIMDMLYPDQGHITVLGQNSHQPSPQLKQAIGYTGDQMGFVGRLTLKQIKQSVAPFFPAWDDNRFKSYMQQLGLDETKTYDSLSKGNKKKFDFIMAVSHHPQLLILDEPTANLDPVAREQILDLCLQQFEQEDMTIFFSSHITTDLDKIADYIVFLHQGRVLLEDTKDHLLETHRLVRGKNEQLVPEVKKLMISAQPNAFGFEGLTANYPVLFELLGTEAIYEKPSLEDIFIHYVQRLN